MAAIAAALGGAGSVIDVGAGTGSYEPAATVLAAEPSRQMLGQRRPGAPPAVQAVAERLPLRDKAADVAMAVLTVHHWRDWRGGLAELRRVAHCQLVLAYDTRLHAEYWLTREYIPEIARLELARPSAGDIADELGADDVVALPVPWDFRDGVYPAYWRRPGAYLDPGVRRNCSALAQTDPAAVSRGIERLRRDLDSGRRRVTGRPYPRVCTASPVRPGSTCGFRTRSSS
ncbi:class I SAM-dependent methyltransferase [Amycolatopsis alkalitolerans]|uniref:Class I SAM-dependent methyltransferase n=1 Tax=Amycolatopsis alkalitolerans TaxID=2547244 RepID=A0A5C4LWX7_9PSEU|nr:class I SAM-dependent methyltransferase [Amycolatopsis alkalitolerans]TNC22942.1 class I SAM-dependent methyltransferase [Amycolatopsis alkalitolerans]